MRSLPLLSAVFLMSTGFLAGATPVFAQVTVDLHALQALPERPGAGRPSRPTLSVTPNRPTVATRETPVAPAPTGPTPNAPAPAAPPAAQPAMPENVPDTASICCVSASAKKLPISLVLAIYCESYLTELQSISKP